MLPTIAQANVFQNQPLVQKLHCPLLRKTLVPEILGQSIFWEMEIIGRGAPSCNMVSGFQHNDSSSIQALVRVLW
jgi:hypothetical protein